MQTGFIVLVAIILEAIGIAAYVLFPFFVPVPTPDDEVEGETKEQEGLDRAL